MIRKRVLPVLVGLGSLSAGTLASGCGGEKSGQASAQPETKQSSVSSVAKSNKVGTPAGPTTIQKGDPIPVEMGGAVAPAPRPPAPAPAPAGSGSSAGAAPQASPPAAAAAAAEAPAAPKAETPAAPTAVIVAHNHPPDQPCKPLTEAEIKQAFGDLK